MALLPIEKKIRAKARGFDIHALIQLLKYIGYTNDEILFKSHLTSISTGTLIENLEFRKKPVKLAIITINLGLLSNQSPLPSYFIKTIDLGYIDEKAFIDFIGFFDHNIIRNYLVSIYPECDTKYFQNWEDTKKNYLRLLALNSVNIIHWLFEKNFPELGLVVERSNHKRRVKIDGVQLGKTALGDDVAFGGWCLLPVIGFDVTLYCDEELTEDQKTPWANVVYKRLQSLFQILKEVKIYLKVCLVIRSQKGWAQLKRGSYLGVDRIHGGEEQARVVLIFQGQVPNN